MCNDSVYCFALAEFTAAVILAAFGAGVPWALENPADRGVKGTPQFWARYHDHAPIWLMPCLQEAFKVTAAEFVTFPQCAAAHWGQLLRSTYTTLAFEPSLAPGLSAFRSLRCSHEWVGHESVAYGYDALGRSRSALAAAYPQ